jgi:hypothetical protein
MIIFLIFLSVCSFIAGRFSVKFDREWQEEVRRIKELDVKIKTIKAIEAIMVKNK